MGRATGFLMRWLMGRSEWGDDCTVPGCDGWLTLTEKTCIYSYKHPVVKKEEKKVVDSAGDDALICEGWVLYKKYEHDSDHWWPYSDDGVYMTIFRNINEADETLTELLEMKDPKDQAPLHTRSQFVLQAVYSDPDSGDIFVPMSLTDKKEETDKGNQ